MKRILFFFIPVFSGITASAQIEMGISYDLAFPMKELAKNVNLTHSAVTNFFYRFKKIPQLRAGMEFEGGTYAQKKEDQHYEFRDGSTTDVEVRFSSNVVNWHVIAVYDLLSNTSIVPYISAKGGFSKFYSSIYIPDPDDAGSCRPIENKNIFKDATWSAGGGAGARMNVNKIFKKSACDRMYFDLSVNYLTGGNLEYLNVKNLQHHEDEDLNAKEFNVRFINIATSELHEHHVSKVLNSRIHQLNLRIGLVMRLF